MGELLLAVLVVSIGVVIFLRLIQGIDTKTAPRIIRNTVIDSYVFDEGCDRRLASLRPELTPEQRYQAWQGLREYFQLFHASKFASSLPMPSQIVDDAWHSFIVDTRRYGDFCKQAFGRFLHHTPEENASRDKSSGPISREIECDNPTYLWSQHTGMPNVGGLPLLFAMDAQIGIQDGFRYSFPKYSKPASRGVRRSSKDSSGSSSSGCAGGFAAMGDGGHGGDGGGSGSSGCGGGGCGGGGD